MADDPYDWAAGLHAEQQRAETGEPWGEPPQGWIKIEENGEPLWKFHRGAWLYHGFKITEVKIGDDGISVWIKVGKK